MLGGDRQIAPQTGQIYTPKTSTTIGAAIQKPFVEVGQLTDYVFGGKSSADTMRESSDRLSIINEQLNTPGQGFGQRAMNNIAGLISSAVATLPLMSLGVAAGGAVAGAVGFGARGIAASALAGEAVEGAGVAYLASQVPLKNLASGSLKAFLPKFTAAELAGGALEQYAGYKAMVIPEHFSENYDAVNDAFDSSHFIEDVGNDNYGFLLGASALAAGYVGYKGVRGILSMRAANKTAKELDEELGRLLRGHEETLKENKLKGEAFERDQLRVSELQTHLQMAEEEGLISPQLHEWYLNYLEHPNHPDTHASALDALKELQIPYDRVTGRVWNEVLSKEGVSNLKGALFDQGITQMSAEDGQLLSSFIIHNQLDAYAATMRENPNLLMAMQGMTGDITRKIAAHDQAIRKFKFDLDSKVPKTTLKRQIFTQNNLYNHLKSIGVTTAQEVPYYVPRRVIEKLQLADEISKIEARETPQYEQKFQNKRHIKLKKKLKDIKLMHHADEMKYMSDRLFPGGKLADDFKTSRAYNRLQDLAQVWPNAKAALDVVHMAAINKKQAGLNEAIKSFISLADSEVGRLADPELVKTYLNRRIDAAVPTAKELKQFNFEAEADIARDSISEVKAVEGEVVEGTPKDTAKSEQVVDEQLKQVVEKSNLEFAKENFDSAEMKIKQWSKSGKAIDDLIACVWGE